MLLKYFYDSALAHASYLVGCQRAKQAIVIDPGRDIDGYLEYARKKGLQIVGVAETHIHADYVSGARELAEKVQAKLYLSDMGPSEWKYAYASQYDSKLLTDGDRFQLGKLEFEVMHTPGHTPESISFLLTDRGGGANEPMGIFTGDFVFVGSIGRPDLLEEAAGIEGSAETGARELFQSVNRFKELPDYLQVWPAHGAGSACGKGLGAIPSSTVGYEKRFNPALQIESEAEFVRYILAEQPEAPTYFALMKKVNKLGPALLADSDQPKQRPASELSAVDAATNLVDLSSVQAFARGHVPGSVNIPLDKLATWAGWILDYSKPTYLVCQRQQLPEAIRVLQKIGLDKIDGFFDVDETRSEGLAKESVPHASPQDLAERIANHEVHLVDVRSDVEWSAGRISQAQHYFLGKLRQRVDSLPADLPIVTQCQTGIRSAIAASIIQAAGKPVTNMSGGMNDWLKNNLPTSTSDCPADSTTTCSI